MTSIFSLSRCLFFWISIFYCKFSATIVIKFYSIFPLLDVFRTVNLSSRLRRVGDSMLILITRLIARRRHHRKVEETDRLQGPSALCRRSFGESRQWLRVHHQIGSYRFRWTQLWAENHWLFTLRCAEEKRIRSRANLVPTISRRGDAVRSGADYHVQTTGTDRHTEQSGWLCWKLVSVFRLCSRVRTFL